MPCLASLDCARSPHAKFTFGIVERWVGLTALIAALVASALGCAPPPPLQTATTHPMQYYVDLPAAWTATSTWPIVVVIDGADHDFAGDFRQFISARGTQPFIIVAPLVLSNSSPYGAVVHGDYPGYSPAVWDLAARVGLEQFDDDGLAAVVADVRRQYAGQDKFFLTGWSAGGLLTWRTVFLHPEQLAGAAPACGNFGSRNVPALPPVSAAPERVNLPIKAFQGADDGAFPALTQQWQVAQQLAAANGYQAVSRAVLPGVGHSACPDQVLQFFLAALPR